MLALHCTGCSRFVDAELNGELGLIVPVSLTTDSWHAGAPIRADLCVRCLARMKARFFGVEPEPVSDELRAHEALLGPPEMPGTLDGLLEANEAV